jgi:hypothetical protein
LRDARPLRRVRAAVAVERPSALADALLETCVRRGASARGPDGSAPSSPPDAQAASGSSSSTRSIDDGGSAAAGRTARAWTAAARRSRPCARRVGDDGAGVDRGGGEQATVDLGDEELAAGDATRVERGEALERRHVGRGGVADGDWRRRRAAG